MTWISLYTLKEHVTVGKQTSKHTKRTICVTGKKIYLNSDVQIFGRFTYAVLEFHDLKSLVSSRIFSKVRPRNNKPD